MRDTFRNLRVLVVDDNGHMRAIVATVLKDLGVRQIAEAEDGSAALAKLKQRSVDVAIVDYLMRPMDGIDFARMVRAAPETQLLPIIMMTGHAEKALVRDARDAGINEFLVKPVTAKSVIDRLNAVIFKPRPFIRAKSYVGPNRRRFASEPVAEERRADPRTRTYTEI